jgi:hypothetical protein
VSRARLTFYLISGTWCSPKGTVSDTVMRVRQAPSLPQTVFSLTRGNVPLDLTRLAFFDVTGAGIRLRRRSIAGLGPWQRIGLSPNAQRLRICVRS